MNDYEALACCPLDEGLGFTIITDLRVKDLKGRLELATKRHTLQ